MHSNGSSVITDVSPLNSSHTKSSKIKKAKAKTNKNVIDEIDESPEYQEKSMFEDSLDQPEDNDLDDIETIIKQAEATIPKRRKKTSLFQKMISKNRGKYAAD